MSAKDSFYMQRCLELAGLGAGKVAPNPMVGCVIVHNGKIIGEGYHEQYGEAHAEVNAIKNVKAEDLEYLKEATLYVNLEPCAHHGKTPPCADLVIEKQLKRVVIGNIDPFSKVAGRGIQKMKEAGIEVVTDVLVQDCAELNKRFFTFHTQQRPYIILKWAETQDGFFAPLGGKQEWISNHLAKQLTHKWRTEEAAIMVGTNTAEIDNPQLTARLWKGQHPLRVLIDRHNRLEPTLNIFNEAAETLIFSYEKGEIAKENVDYSVLKKGEEEWSQIMKVLYERDVLSVLIEGGKQLIDSLLKQNLWDEIRVFTGNKSFGEGIAAPVINSHASQAETIGDNQLKIYRNTL